MARKSLALGSLILTIATGTSALATPSSPECNPPDGSPAWRWLRRPSNEDIRREARRLRGTGRAVLRCVVDSTGHMSNCVVVAETPENLGVGEVALRLAPIFKLTPVNACGASTEGDTIFLPIRLVAP